MKEKRSKTEASFKPTFFEKFSGKINFVSKSGLQTLLLPKSSSKENIRLPTQSTFDKKSYGYGRKIKTDHRANRLHTDVEYQSVKLPLIENKNRQYINYEI